MKKALSLLLAFVLILGMGTVTFAAAQSKITAFPEDDSWWTGSLDNDVGDVSPHFEAHSDAVNEGDAGTIVLTGIDTDTFVIDDDPAATAAITKQLLANSKVTVEIKASKGAACIDNIGFYWTGSNTTDDVDGFKIEMVEPFASNNPDGVDFEYRVYLSINKSLATGKSTYKDSVTVTGTYKNAVDEIDGNGNYFEFFDGRILKPTANINNLEARMDENGDVVVAMNARKDAHYWGYAKQKGQTYTLTTLGIQQDCKYVLLENVSSESYVYNGSNKLLGRGGDQLPFSTTYRVYDSPLSSGSGSGSGSGSNSGGGYTAPSAPASAPVNTATAVQNVKDVVSAAKNSSDGANVKLKNVSTVSLATLKEMAKAAGNTDLKVSADSLAPNGGVDVRITIDPSKAKNSIDLSASTTSAAAKSVEKTFQKYFNNTVSVVSLSQKGSFGMPVTVAAKVDKKLDTKALVFYSYDSKTGKYTQIKDPQYKVDKNGYVHFTTSLGGEIVISDKPLKKK